MSGMCWMAWDDGVDLVACTRPGLDAPNLILHVARSVRTPAGTGPGGMVLYQPDPHSAPEVMGFLAEDKTLSAYFGPSVFAGTPFESAPALTGEIEIVAEAGMVGSKISVGGRVFETRLRGLGPLEKYDRGPGDFTPFEQRVLEAVASEVEVKVDGVALDLTLPPVGISGGAPAVWTPAGFYCR